MALPQALQVIPLLLAQMKLAVMGAVAVAAGRPCGTGAVVHEEARLVAKLWVSQASN